MSQTIHTTEATCRLNVSTADEAIQLYTDWVFNHPEDAPEWLQDLTEPEVTETVSHYVTMRDDGQIVVTLDTEGANGVSDIYDSIALHFQSLQTSKFMVVRWHSHDTRTGFSFGTDYYNSQGEPVDVESDSEALDRIHSLMANNEWDSDLWQKVADVLDLTGRTLPES